MSIFKKSVSKNGAVRYRDSSSFIKGDSVSDEVKEKLDEIEEGHVVVTKEDGSIDYTGPETEAGNDEGNQEAEETTYDPGEERTEEGYPSKDGKMRSVFSDSEAEVVRYHNKYMVPMTQEEHDTRSGEEIDQVLKKLKIV